MEVDKGDIHRRDRRNGKAIAGLVTRTPADRERRIPGRLLPARLTSLMEEIRNVSFSTVLE